MPVIEYPSVPELIVLAAKLPATEFSRRFPHHCLITEVIGTTAGWSVPTGAMQAGAGPSISIEVASFRAGERGFLGVAPVVKRDGANPYASMITIGRARNNDLPITDISVSKLHAWIRRGQSGTWDAGEFTITDAGSRNGTFVDGHEVLREPHPLPPGAKVRLGLVEFLFVDPSGLHEALRNAPHQMQHGFP
jgi:hypothetical protein